MNGKWLEFLGQASLSAAVMVLAVVILRIRFRRRTPQRVYCLLWDIVLLRLLVPVPVASPWSIRSLIALRPSQVQEAIVSPALQTGTAVLFAGPAGTAWSEAVPTGPDPLTLLWCAGMILCVGWLLWGHLQSRSLYAMSLPLEDSFIRGWQDGRPLRRFVQVRRSDRIAAPLTYGVLQPVVLLPSRMDLTDRENLAYVLEHEYTHIQRFDTLRKYLLAAGLCLHWFNPLVWLMYFLANRDIELACDEAVVRSGADRRGYALALLRLEEERGGLALSGSHFSGHALEERIEAIMKHKNISLAALLVVLVVMSVTTTVFATSAPEGGHQTALVTGREIGVVAQDTLTISKGGDGTQFFSLDGGESWLSEEQYHARYGSWGDDWEVEWWTYDAYKAWLEQEKKELAEIIGARGYTSDKGWFVWDQAMVDETIAMYEETLEHIKNGGLYSKSIIDPSGEAVQEAVLSSGPVDIDVAYALEGDEYTIVDYTQTVRRKAEETAALLESLRAFGVTGSEEDGLYYNGKLIRCFVDGYSVGDGCGIRYVYNNADGVIDVHTLREEIPLPGGGVDPAGPLKGVASKGDQGYDPNLIACATADSLLTQTTSATAEGSGSAAGVGRTFAEIFAGYSPWGLRYDADAENQEILTYNGQPVAYFADLKPNGSVFSYDNPYVEKGLNVYTVYDKDGSVTGLKTE